MGEADLDMRDCAPSGPSWAERRGGDGVTPNARRRSRGRGATSVNRKEKLRLQWHQVIPLSKEYGRHGRQRNLEELKTGQKTGV